MNFPASGVSSASIKKALKQFEIDSKLDPSGLSKQLCASYSLTGLKDLRMLNSEVMSEFLESNRLIDHEAGLIEMERQVLSMIGSLLRAKPNTGIFTAGGTESNILALLAARNLAGRRGDVVLPSNAHPSFFKGCDLLGLRPVKVEVDKSTFKADPQKIDRAITRDTIAVIATAGSWPMGVIDPLKEIGEIAEKRSLYYHIDAAWGGLICPWLRMAGYSMPDIGFRIPGVFSISVDPHKQGFSILPSGSITFSENKLRNLAGWEITEAGFSYRTLGIWGSRPGFSIAATWAVFNYLGQEGYVELSKKCYDLTMKLIEDSQQISGILFPVVPSINLTTMVSNKLDMNLIKKRLKTKGWMFFESSGEPFSFKNGIILAVFPYHEKVFPEFLKDLRLAAKAVDR